MMLALMLQISLVVLLPALVIWAERRVSVVRVLSPVLVCYLVGLLLGNQPLLPIDGDSALLMSGISVALAIPLLLFSTDILGWLRLAPVTVLSFALAIVSAASAACLGHLIFSPHLAHTAPLAGMLTGVYIGGTPNMATIGTALGVEPELFVQLNAADLLATAVYLVFIFMAAQRVLGLVLPAFAFRGDAENDAGTTSWSMRPTPRLAALEIALAAMVVGVGVLFSRFFAEGTRDGVAILAITTLSIALSTRPRVRNLPGTSQTGHYFLLMFCIAIGSTANFSRLIESSLTLLLMVFFVLFGSFLLHVLLASLFRIDRDTVIVTSVAGITNPALIAPVAVALKNREVVVSGIASGLVGYAVANYVGMLVAWILT